MLIKLKPIKEKIPYTNILKSISSNKTILKINLLERDKNRKPKLFVCSFRIISILQDSLQISNKTAVYGL
jgi:hypothetical protein